MLHTASLGQCARPAKKGGGEVKAEKNKLYHCQKIASTPIA